MSVEEVRKKAIKSPEGRHAFKPGQKEQLEANPPSYEQGLMSLRQEETVGQLGLTSAELQRLAPISDIKSSKNEEGKDTYTYTLGDDVFETGCDPEGEPYLFVNQTVSDMSQREISKTYKTVGLYAEALRHQRIIPEYVKRLVSDSWRAQEDIAAELHEKDRHIARNFYKEIIEGK